MKKTIFLFSFLLTSFIYSQNYSPVINYKFTGSPTNGVKIKTNIPFGAIMPTIIIEGYNYGDSKPIGLILDWYVYAGQFHSANVSSFGAYTPDITLYNEGGKVVIYLDDRKYYNRFTIRAYDPGVASQGSDLHYQNWTIEDELPTGTISRAMEYKNKFAGKIEFPGGIWNEDGNLGIGTTDTFGYKLAVNGTIGAKEVKVEISSPWPDYVFSKEYKLPTLKEVEKQINEKKHLTDIPSAKEVKENKGILLGEMNAKLLQKIEELTLYTIQQEKKLKHQNKEIEELKIKFQRLEKLLTKN